MTTEIYLNDLNYSDLKQALDFAACTVVDTDWFRDMYHNLSYFVPNDICDDKWKCIHFVVDMIIHDYQTIYF